MNRFCFIIGIIIGFCSVGQSVWANTAYIIDFTKVNFRSGPSTEYRVTATLSSGQPLEILETQGNWTHVSFQENGNSIKEGWILSRYLMTRQPWELKAQSLIRENTTLKEKLAPIEKMLEEKTLNEQNLTKKLQDSIKEVDKVRQELKSIEEGAAEYLDLKKKHEKLQSQFKKNQQENKELTEEYNKLESSQRIKWFIAGGIVLMSGLFIGLILGGRRRYSKSSL
ncbi:MAG: TIGR04211 family SH3 domain-containing protein [Planctomycetota bacterium]|jgi:SH3 domain protein